MLRIVFWVIILVLFLSFFGISVESLFESPTTQSNFHFVLGLAGQGWETIWNFISGAVTSVTDFMTGLLHIK